MLWHKKTDQKINGRYTPAARFFVLLKCAEIPFFTGLFLLVSIVVFRQVGFERWYARPGLAATTTFTETFASTTYKDTANSTAEWFGLSSVKVAATGTFTIGQWKNPNTGYMYMTSISCLDASNCFMAGNGATVMKTTNGGTTWTRKHDVGTNMGGIKYGTGAVPGLYDIEAINSSVIYGVGILSAAATTTKGFIIKSSDGGDTWNIVYKETVGKYLQGIDCVDVNTCFVAGGNGSLSGKVILTTTDGGANWNSETMPAGNYDLYDVSAYNDGASTTIHAVGGASGTGTILKGQGTTSFTWRYESSTSTKYFSNVKCTDIGNCIAVGGYGQTAPVPAFVTHDGGTTWSQRAASTASIDALDCAPNATSTCWLGGSAYSGGIYLKKSTDGGETWSSVTYPGNSRVLDIFAVSDVVAFAGGGVNGGDDPGVAKTTDGTTWADVTSAWTPPVYSISGFRGVDCLDANTCWTVDAGYGGVWQTTDGGDNWTLMNFAEQTTKSSVDFVNSTTGWFAGNNGTIKKSTDSGTNWSSQTCPYCSAGHLTEVKMWNANVGYLVGTGGQIHYTTDGGSSGWASVTSTLNNTTNSWYSVWPVSTTTAYIGGFSSSSRGVIYKTNDSGTNWNLQKDTGASDIIASIFCLDSAGTQCWALNGNGGEIFKTTDGSTWAASGILGSSGNTGSGRIYFLTDNVGVAAHSTFFFSTRDGGRSWATSSYSSGNWEYLDKAGSNLIMVGTGGQLDKVAITPASSSIAQSLSVDEVAGDIICANATVTSSTPGNSYMTFQMSNNAGANWISAGGSACGGGSGMNFNFATSGSDLRWKSELFSGSTPELSAVSIIYSTNDRPATTTNSSPSNGATGVLSGPTLTTAAFSDPNSGDTHTTSQWVIADNSGNGTVFQNTGASSTDLTSHTVTGLTAGTTYGWSAKHCDQYGACSPSSATTTFTVAASGAPGGSAAGRIAPSAPVSGSSTALSASSIRWYFEDTANNEEGFEIKDETGKVLVSTQPYFSQNRTSLDEENLHPNSKYCHRQVFAFNGVGFSEGSAEYPCRATLAKPPKPLNVLNVSFTDAKLSLNPNDGNPTGTQFAFYETATKKWIGLGEADPATTTLKYILSDTPVWQHYGAWGSSSGFTLSSLEQGAKYSIESVARNSDGVASKMDPTEAPVQLQMRTSGAKLSVTLGVAINSTSKTAGIMAPGSGKTPGVLANIIGIIIVAFAGYMALNSPAVFAARPRKTKRLALKSGKERKIFVFNFARLKKMPVAVSFVLAVVLAINLLALAKVPVTEAQVDFADSGKTVTPGTTLVYRAVVTSIGTDPVGNVSLVIPVPVGAQYEKGSLVLDGVAETDDLDADSASLTSAGAKTNLGDMMPGDNHSFYVTVKVLSTALTVSNTAVAYAAEFPKGLKSNTVSNPVKVTTKPVEELPVRPREETAPPTEQPAQPAAVRPVILSPKSGAVINNARPTITGRSAANASVEILIDGKLYAKAQSNASGAFSYSPESDLSDGEHIIQAVSLGLKSVINKFTVDTVPAIPSSIEISIVRELPTKDPKAYETTFQISGVSDAGTEKIEFIIATPEEKITTYEPETSPWKTFITETVTEGLRSISVVDIDSAGNRSSETKISFNLAPPECSDRLDNDSDRLIDFPSDPGCYANADPSELEEPLPLAVKPQCSDRIDNDGDGGVDYPADPGCSGAEDNDESDIGTKPENVLPACADGIDNDGDGLTDYPDDNGCSGSGDADETNFIEKMGLGLVNGIVNVSEFINVQVLNNPVVETGNKAVAPALAVAALANTATAAGLGAFLSWLQLLGAQPILLLTGRKKQGFGIVYNSLSKLPIDLASVHLIDSGTGRAVGSQVTDKFGRYYFLAPPGSFKLEVTKPGFVFPSPLLASTSADAQYADIYHGENITTGAGGPVAKSVPADPVTEAVSREKVLRSERRRDLARILAIAGPVLAGISLLITPKPLYLGVFAAHLAFYGIFARLAAGAKPKAWGIVRDGKTGSPVPLAIVRIFSKQYNKLLETKVTDAKGRYAFLVGASDYYLTVEKPGYTQRQAHELSSKESNLPTFVTETLTLDPAGAIAPKTPVPSSPPIPPVTPSSPEPEIFTPPKPESPGK